MPTRASTRSTATATRCTATPRTTRARRSFATHSTHKLLAALSQASLLHIRDGRSPIPHARFNESFMMHASTSPLYTIIVSNDVTAAMMDGPGGIALTSESIQEAVAFRQTMGRVHRQFAQKKDWFFNTWNADKVSAGKGGKKVAFEDAPPELARDRPRRLGAAPRRQLARLRRPRGRLLHARPDQGVDRDAGCRRQGRPRQARHPGDARDRLPPPPRRRGREDDRLHDPVPVLDRHHQGQVGDAAQRPARLQGRLRPERAARRGAAGPRRGAIPGPTAASGSATSPIRCSRSSRSRGRRTGWPRRSRRCRCR